MSVCLAVAASILCVAVIAALVSVLCRPDGGYIEPPKPPQPARPLAIRPATPNQAPARVWQCPAAVGTDPMRHPLRRDERHQFDAAVYAHDFVPTAPEPTPRSNP